LCLGGRGHGFGEDDGGIVAIRMVRFAIAEGTERGRWIMKNSVYTTAQIADILAPLFAEYNVNKALLFGSYAKGLADENSDIDLCVDSGLHGLDFMVLVDEVSERLDKQVDMFDLTHIKKSSRIEQEINVTGVVIYEK
jgi:predicted nucleotidyltransferase